MMEKVKQELQEAEQAFEATHSSKINKLLERNRQYINSFKPVKQSLDMEKVSLAMMSIENKKFIFFTPMDYNPTSKFYSPINDNISFPYYFNIPKTFGFNSLAKGFCESPEFTEIKPILKKYFASHKYTNPITKEKLGHMTRMLRRKYPGLVKIPLVLSAFCDVDLKLTQKVYYDTLRQESLQDDAEDQSFDFMKMAVFFCKICKIYLCDLHFDCDLIKNRAWDRTDGQAIEKMYFMERTKREVQPELDKFQLDLVCYHSQQGHRYLPVDEAKLEINDNFMLLLNTMTFIKAKSPCVVAKIFNINCGIIRSILAKFKSKFDRNYYLKDFLDITMTPDELEFELYPRALTYSAREIKNQSILCRIDTEFSQKFLKRCTCTVDCSKISEISSSKKQPQRCACCVQGHFIRKGVSAEHLQVQLPLQPATKTILYRRHTLPQHQLLLQATDQDPHQAIDRLHR
jgi:hypothetical protein